MKKLLVLLILLVAFQSSHGGKADTVVLKPKTVYGREARVISYILDSYHYRKIGIERFPVSSDPASITSMNSIITVPTF